MPALRTYLKPLRALESISVKSTRSWFTATEIAQIYQIPAPNQTNVVVGVVSFGGGLYGSVDSNGVLTNGDIQAYWSAIGIPANAMPKVIIVPINGARNQPSISQSDGGATMENTIDVETIGGCCPSANLTIIVYIAPNIISQFYNIFQYILLNTLTINGRRYKPSIISVSWGAPEIYYPRSLLTDINALLAAATSQGINICTASGDNGSNNGVGGSGSYTDFPSSCPYVTAVGGTHLVCPSLTYANETTSESAWTRGGGAISSVFPRPSYQSVKCPNATGRSVPDIASNADPNTGIAYIINGQVYVVGGTSIAAPTIAGFLASINAKQFINPILYAASTGFHDVVSGTNGAYSSKVGYDNCTGLGSLNCSLLTALLTSVTPSGPTGSSGPTGPTGPIIHVTSVKLNISKYMMRRGQTFAIVATVLPTYAGNKSVTWASANSSIVKVSMSGLITPLRLGTTRITVTTVDGSKTASAMITVFK